MNYYKIEHVYNVGDTHYTLVLSAISKKEADRLPHFGEFSMNLLNGEEVGLDQVRDALFIEQQKKKQIFFADLRKDYFDAIADGRNVEGMVIIDVVDKKDNHEKRI